jgi:hypothetical protein
LVRTKDVDMTIEFIEVEEEGFGSTKLEVFINSNLVHTLPLKRGLGNKSLGKRKDYYYLNLQRYKNPKKESLTNEIGMLTLSALPEKLLLGIPSNTKSFTNKIFTDISSTPNTVIFEIELIHNMDEWTYPFSVKVLNQYLRENFVSNNSKMTNASTQYCALSFEISKDDTSVNLKELIFDAAEKLLSFYNQSINELNEKHSENLFVKLFDFPPEYANICSQYLMWFGEFLKNLGIDADVSTENKDGKTSLIVSPTENGEMLEQIEQLFYQYLALPYADFLPASKQTPQEMYAYQSAMSQIDNLKNQIQMKDTILQLHQATNSALTEKLILQANQPLLLESLKDEKKYELFGGLISIPAKQEFGKNKNVSIDLEKLFSKKNKTNKDDE